MRVVAYIHIGNVWEGQFSYNFVWEELCGKPIILHMINRLKRSRFINEVILFLQDDPINKKVIGLAKDYGLSFYFHGRMYGRWDASIEFRKRVNDPDIEVHIPPSTFPLIDHRIIDQMIAEFISSKLDYMEMKGFPNGIGSVFIVSNRWVEFSNIDRSGDLLKGRIGWVGFLGRYPDIFKTGTFEAEGLYREPNLQLQVDSPKQLRLVRKIYNRFYKEGDIIDGEKVISLYKEEPDWFKVLFLDNIEIELTNNCNLNCIMCPRHKMTREIGYMDFEIYKKIIDEYMGMTLVFSLFGEPLLHPEFLKMIEYAKGKVNIILYTNGVNLDEETSKAILNNPSVKEIFFSLDAITSETYERIKGAKEYDKVVKNILRFLELRKEKISNLKEYDYCGDINPITVLQIIRMKENDHEIEAFWSRWSQREKIEKILNWKRRCRVVEEKLKALREKIEDTKRKFWREQKENIFVKRPEELRNVETRLEVERQNLYSSLLWHKTFYEWCDLPIEHIVIGHFNQYCGQIENRSVIDVTPLKRFPCKQLQSGLSVLWNGDVVLCRQDFNGKYPLGNLKDQSYSEILEGEKLKVIWQAHKNKEYDNLPLCANCKEWYYNLYA